MTLELRQANQTQTAEVYDVAGESRALRFFVRSPQEALELFRLLDEELSVCCVCDQPMWVAVGGICGDKGAYCNDCGHPRCSPLECDGGRAVSGL